MFTPDSKYYDNYETVTATIPITVKQAEPYIQKAPVAAAITYGDTLCSSILSNGMVQYSVSDSTTIAGSFTWEDADLKPTVADSGSTKYTVIFTPTDTVNYSTMKTDITLTVNKAEKPANIPGATMNVANNCQKVGEVTLPNGWQWESTSLETPLVVGAPVSAVATYTGTDKANYENLTTTIAIIRAAAQVMPPITPEQPNIIPTTQPTVTPTKQPTLEPTQQPTVIPTEQPTIEPTKQPSVAPSEQPTIEPTEQPSVAPTEQPTTEPTVTPTEQPTIEPTVIPTEQPTIEPTVIPTEQPIVQPTTQPTFTPTVKPTKNVPKKKGTKIKDASGNWYKVVNDSSKNPAVEYVNAKKGATGHIKIPNTVTFDKVTYKIASIADNACKNQKKITRVTIGNQVTKIGKNAFKNCSALKTLTIGKRVEKISKNACNECKSLEKITIKSTMLNSKNWSKQAFKNINKKVEIVQYFYWT